MANYTNRPKGRFKVGDYVIVDDENTPNFLWVKGQITEILNSYGDEMCRLNVDVNTISNRPSLRYALNKGILTFYSYRLSIIDTVSNSAGAEPIQRWLNAT